MRGLWRWVDEPGASDQWFARVEVRRGAWDGSQRTYLRIAPFFETSAPHYAWLNQIVAVGLGERVGGDVAYDMFEIL